MAISAEEFLKIAKRTSKLDAFKEDIIKLRQAKVSYKEIVRFLEMNDVKTSVSNLGHFINKLESEQAQITPKSKKTDAVMDTLKISSSAEGHPNAQTKPPAAGHSNEPENRPNWATQRSLKDICGG
ncbi:hypothetical protein [Snodgrassella alvi]|uniref:hypothetical protein n=1 Tax=Snodgrassella alvi TaxID=1196083 RepID=UPI003511F55C